MKKRVRIKDIAEHLGINPSTVSRALNPVTMAMISNEVVAVVQETAHQLGYIIDETAAGLRRQKTMIVGVVVPDILNPLFPPILKGIQNYLSNYGYVAFIVYTNNDINQATMEIQKLIARRVDGMIMASAFLEDSSVNYCISQKTPLVLVNRSILDGNKVHQVLDNDSYGISLAIEHLKELGHRKLVHLAGPQNVSGGKERLETFIICCQAHGLDYEIIQLDYFDVESGRKGAHQLLERNLNCSGIIAGNDMIAIGTLQVLQERGKRIPEDLSLVGFNGTLLSDMLNPPLTTVAIPHQTLGEKAASILLEEIANPDGPKQKILLTPKLLIRKSTAIAP